MPTCSYKHFFTAVAISHLLMGELHAQQAPPSAPSAIVASPAKFRKVMVAAESYESAGVMDVNKDGNPDIVSGAFWYAGPGFVQRSYIGEVKRYDEYYDDFSTIPIDVNKDGYPDFVTGGWWGNSVRWRQNPGGAAGKPWPEHVIGECGNVETTRAWDVDGDGELEIVPNNPGRPLLCFKLTGPAQFTKYTITEKQGHGIGFGDIDGDGRGDFIISTGWVQAPADTWKGTWLLHNDFQLGETGIPIVVADVNKDGLNDLLVGQGHAYGLHWYEQKFDAKTKKRSFVKHAIDPFNSQFHTLLWDDLDGDGEPELITGKRFRAHSDKDPGAHDDIGLYYYKWNGDSFTKHVIAYGPLGVGKGTGNYFAIADLHHSGRKDIVVAGKDGLYIFYNEGK